MRNIKLLLVLVGIFSVLASATASIMPVLTTLSSSTSPRKIDHGGNATCVSAGAENLLFTPSYVVSAYAAREFYTGWPYWIEMPVYVWMVLKVDGQIVASIQTPVNNNPLSPTMVSFSYDYLVSPGTHFVEFYCHDDCEIQGEIAHFFYYSMTVTR